jgi:peptidoglycan/xylan/chitin deacetylase (PgdA/CDA1 family)
MRPISIFWHSIDPDSISPDHQDGTNSTVSMFRDQIEFLLDKHIPISVCQFVDIIHNPDLIGSYRKRPVLLGFDDGFRNVITQALPILKEFQIPAVFFVIGEVLRNPAFVPWFIEFKYLIRRTERKRVDYEHVHFDLSSRNDYVRIAHLFDATFKACRSEPDRQSLLTTFAELLDVRRPTAWNLDEDLRFVTREDLTALGSSSLLTVASHAMTHRYLDSLSYAEQVAELEQSDVLLRHYCPSYYPVLSYPGGSFNRDTIAIAKQIYKFGFAVFLGASYSNRYAYPRTGINHASVQDVAYCISPKRLNYLLPLKRLLHVTGIRRLT